MARYEHLPIYKAALDLTVHVEKVVAGMSRHHKYSLGAEMRAACRSVLQQVVRANNAADRARRAAELVELRERIDALIVTLRVAREVRAFRSFAAYLHAVEQVGG